MACTVMGISPWPVTNMIGIPGCSTATRFCKSRPLSPGRATSRIRQLGTKTGGLARNSCAETNVSTHQSAFRRSASSVDDHQTQSAFGVSQCVFRLSFVLNVDQKNIPAFNLSLWVSQRKAASLKPSKHAVIAAAAAFEVEGFAGLNGVGNLCGRNLLAVSF